MSHPSPNEQPRHDAALGDPADGIRDLPAFQPVSQIEREIARSERASAALAAVAALARASSGPDADPVADTAAVDLGSAAWTQTEYAPFDPTPVARRQPAPPAAAPATPTLRTVDRRKTPRPPKPGDSLLNAFDAAPVAAMPAFPAPPVAPSVAPVAAPRPPLASAIPSRFTEDSGFGQSSGYSMPHADSRLGAPSQFEQAARAPAVRPRSGDTGRLLMAGVAGAVAVLVAGAAWKYSDDPGSFLPGPSHTLARKAGGPGVTPASPAAPMHVGTNSTVPVDADADTRRALAQSKGEIPLAAPAAGADAGRDDAVTEALAAAARVLAVSRTRLSTNPAQAAQAPAAGTAASVAAPLRSVRTAPTFEQKANVAAAIAQAQARSDHFLGVAGTAAAPATTQDPARAP